MDLKANSLQRKINKLTQLIDRRLIQNPNKGLLVVPGAQGWPRISQEVAYYLKSADWTCLPIVVKFQDTTIVEFLFIGRNAVEIWDLWTSVISGAWKETDKFSQYQKFVYNNLVEQTPSFKEALEKSYNLKLASFICPPLLQIKTPESEVKFVQKISTCMGDTISNNGGGVSDR